MPEMRQRKKLSKGTWLLLLLLAIVFIVAIVLHFTYQAVGFGFDLSFLGGIGTGLMEWGVGSGWSALIILAIPFILGILFLYTLKAYFIGEVVQIGAIPNTGMGYNPAPTTPSQPTQDKETVIS